MRGDSESKPVLAVTGLAVEARIAAGCGVEVVCSGGDPARLRALLEALALSRYCAVISFGISGALDPALQPGHIIVATEIASDADIWPLAAGLTRALSDRVNRLGQATCASVAGANAPVIHAAGKARLRAQTGAVAVDMESHVAASFAAAAGVPAGALRAISDPAERDLPALAMRALRPDGRVDLPAVWGGLARNPAQIPLLVQAGLDARLALAALRRVRGALQLGFGFGGADLR